MRVCLFTVLCAALLAAGGCNTFEHRWRKAATADLSTSALAGRWKGSWQSEPSGHNGALRCIITPIEGDRYRAEFKATWAAVLNFERVIELDASRDGDRVTFAGEEDLGQMWGVYRHEGHVDGDTYFSRYTADNDHGTFEMTRVVD